MPRTETTSWQNLRSFVRVLGRFWQPVFIAITFGASLTALANEKSNIPLSALHPSVYTFEVDSDGTLIATRAILPDGSSYPALLLKYQSRVTYDVPAGQQCLRGILYRADAASGGAAQEDFNRMQVRLLLDGKEVYETVLDVTMPPERFAVPLNGAKKITVAVDQMLAGGALYLADAAFSTEDIPHAVTTHVLSPGSAYANLGAGVRQLAFHTYHPGDQVPLQLQFAGHAQHAVVAISITSRRQARPTTISVPVDLHGNNNNAIGVGEWRVPPDLGPAQLDLQASVNGTPIYQRTIPIAIARKVDLSRDPSSSTFGVHLSSAGIPYLADSVADLWGAKWARVFLRWEIVENTRGQYDWSRIDEVIRLYHNQNMEVLGVLGETAPHWATPSGPETIAAFSRFTKAAIEHFHESIRYWDVYNEIDSKYHGGIVLDKSDPMADIRVLREETSTIREAQPEARLVCCSTGTSYWLAYDKRLYDNGLLTRIDILSLHPYQTGPPEERDGVFTYVEMINALRALERDYGADKPVWSTEANWLIGPHGQQGVLAPDVDEHSQSEYVVRVNLLSMALGVPYFLHSPFFTPFRRQLFLDSVSSYANMTYNLGEASDARQLDLPAGVYGITARSGTTTVCVLWTTRALARAKVTGMTGMHFQDMYGNTIDYDAGDITLSGDPTYIVGSGTPSVSVQQTSALASATALPDPWTWQKSPIQTYTQTPDGVRVTTRPSNYGNLLKSPQVEVAAGGCYIVSTEIRPLKGGVALVAMDGETGKRLGETINLFTVSGHEDYHPVLKVKSSPSNQIQIMLIADNPNEPEVTSFEIAHPQIAHCDR